MARGMCTRQCVTCVTGVHCVFLQKAQAAIQGAKVSPKIASLLRKIVTYPNIPRKKKKFEVSTVNCSDPLLYNGTLM